MKSCGAMIPSELYVADLKSQSSFRREVWKQRTGIRREVWIRVRVQVKRQPDLKSGSRPGLVGKRGCEY